MVGTNFKSDPMTTEVFKTEIGIHTMEFPITCIKNSCKEITYKTSILTHAFISRRIN